MPGYSTAETNDLTTEFTEIAETTLLKNFTDANNTNPIKEQKSYPGNGKDQILRIDIVDRCSSIKF